MSKQDYSRRQSWLAAEPDKYLPIDFGNTKIKRFSVFALTSAAVTITVDVSIDGENWRNLDSFSTAGVPPAAKALKNYLGTHRFVRAGSVTALQDVLIEIAGI